jgi:vancomycin permeability regulator SanA
MRATATWDAGVTNASQRDATNSATGDSDPSGRVTLLNVFVASTRGVALFAGLFTALNLVGEIAHSGFDANLWWIDLRALPHAVGNILLALSSIAFLIFAFNKSRLKNCSKIIVVSQELVLALLFVFTIQNSVRVIQAVGNDKIATSTTIPFSAYVALGLALVAAGIWLHRSRNQNNSIRYKTEWLSATVGFAFSVLMFPFLQIHCFGNTDYRRPADVAVVLGCRVYQDGRLSMALGDRVRTAAELYNDGLVQHLIMSGGPGPGDVHETEAMRRFAVELGVPADRIILDKNGLNTDMTVQNTVPLFEQHGFKRVLAVSHYFHLPRIKLTYRRAGQSVFTVPASQKFRLVRREWQIAREIVALWAYYLRPLTGV